MFKMFASYFCHDIRNRFQFSYFLLSDIASNISRNDALHCQEHIQSGNISSMCIICYLFVTCFLRERFDEAGYNLI